MKTRNREIYFETPSKKQFWCSQGWIRYPIQFFSLQFILEDVLWHTLDSHFDISKIELDIWFDSLVYDLYAEIYCGIHWKTSFQASKVEYDTQSNFRF